MGRESLSVLRVSLSLGGFYLSSIAFLVLYSVEEGENMAALHLSNFNLLYPWCY
jgi:hypothetical protein